MSELEGPIGFKERRASSWIPRFEFQVKSEAKAHPESKTTVSAVRSALTSSLRNVVDLMLGSWTPVISASFKSTIGIPAERRADRQPPIT
jgi:hypothetical protein